MVPSVKHVFFRYVSFEDEKGVEKGFEHMDNLPELSFRPSKSRYDSDSEGADTSILTVLDPTVDCTETLLLPLASSLMKLVRENDEERRASGAVRKAPNHDDLLSSVRVEVPACSLPLT